MFDQKIRVYIDPVLNTVAKWLYKHDISPNTVTFMGALIAVYCFIALLFQAYILALIFLIANRIADGLDGVLAHYIEVQNKKPENKKSQKIGATALGSYLDIVFDMLFYGGFIFFYALGRNDIGDAAAFLLFGFMGTSSSFLAYAILVEKSKKAAKPKSKNKGFYYAIGLMEGSETIGFFILMCLLPKYFNWIASIFALLCLTTAGLRIKLAYDEYK